MAITRLARQRETAFFDFCLVSIIDEHVFGDARTFRDMYVSVSNEEIRNRALKFRLQQFCKRTLRKQVTAYANYTSCFLKEE